MTEIVTYLAPVGVLRIRSQYKTQRSTILFGSPAPQCHQLMWPGCGGRRWTAPRWRSAWTGWRPSGTACPARWPRTSSRWPPAWSPHWPGWCLWWSWTKSPKCSLIQDKDKTDQDLLDLLEYQSKLSGVVRGWRGRSGGWMMTSAIVMTRGQGDWPIRICPANNLEDG